MVCEKEEIDEKEDDDDDGVNNDNNFYKDKRIGFSPQCVRLDARPMLRTQHPVLPPHAPAM